MNLPTWTRDLLPSERTFVTAMQRLGHGRYEFLSIHGGEFVLDPWPLTIRSMKLGTVDPLAAKQIADEFALKPQVVELFEYVRAVDSGEIRVLEIKNGLPFSMEIEHRPEPVGGRRDA
jgi:hypothetical protein